MRVSAALFLVFAWSVSAMADEWIACTVKYEADAFSQVFEPFNGGQFVMNTENAHAYLVAKTADGTEIRKDLVNDQKVSSYQANRKNCAFERSVSRNPDGSLQSFLISLGSCPLYFEGSQQMKAAVSASEFFDFQKNHGHYLESYWDNVEFKEPFFRIENCRPQQM